ncbi:MAG: FtsX-like permease family protein [Actinomycetota bacterium]
MLWRKAPLVLLRFPGLLAALAAGALLLSFAAASSSLWRSATQNDLVRAAVGNPIVTRYGAGVSFQTSTLPLSLEGPDGRPMYEVQEEAFEGRTARSPLLGPVLSGVLGPTVVIAPAGEPSRGREVRPLARTEGFEHVELLRGGPGSGLWISDMTARGLRVGPGDAVTLRLQQGPSVEVTVDGIYRALHTQPSTGYWRALHGHIYRRCLLCAIPPPFVLGDRDLVLSLLGGLEAPTAAFTFDAPASRVGMTFDEARDLERFADDFLRDVSRRRTDLHGVFRCCGPRFEPYPTDARFVSLAPQVVSEVERRLAPVEVPVRILAGVGLLVAVGVVAAAGRFTMAARRTEAALLSARGTPPATIAIKAVLEALLPAAVGGAAGLGAAILVLVTLGPERAVVGVEVGRAALLAWLAAVVLVGVVSGIDFLARGPRHRRGLGGLRYLGEAAVVLLAGWSAWFLLRGGPLIPGDPTRSEPASPFLPLFPIAFIGAFGALGARLVRGAFGRLRTRSGRMPPATFLAVHRLAAAPGLVIVLMAIGALSLGVFLNGGSMVRSLQATVEAKAGVIVGSEATVRVPYGFVPTQPLGFPTTPVTRWRDAGALLPGGISFDLLVVDPATFTGAAAWEGTFADTPVERLVGRLHPAEDGAPIPVIVSGLAGDVGAEPALEIASRRLPIRVVGRATTFPSQLATAPLVVMDARAIPDRFGLTNPLDRAPALTELWMRAPPSVARTALAPFGIPPEDVLTTEEVERTPTMAAVISTFAVLNGLAVTVGLLAVVVLLMYLQARQRGQVVSYALSLRMGLSDASHRRAVLQEVGAMMGSALLLGVGLSAAASATLIGRLDPVTAVPPSPILVFPVAIVPVAVVGLAVVSWLAGRLTNRRARRTDLAGVMRGGA